MIFKEWINLQTDFLLEFGDITQASTEDVHLEPEPGEFNEYDASRECSRKFSDYNYSEEFEKETGLKYYSNFRQDPNFKGQHLLKWINDNRTFLANASQEEKNHWREMAKKVRNELNELIDEWDTETADTRQKYEEFGEKLQRQCVKEKKKQWDKEQKESPNKWLSKFSVNGDEFNVHFEKDATDLLGYGTNSENNNTYSISFMGPQGHSLTGKGVGQNTIYNKLMLSVKRLLDTVKVDALVFSAADITMNLIYHKFYKRYLSKEFLKINSSTYVRKEVLRELLNKMPEDERTNHLRDILSNYRNTLTKGRQLQSHKNDYREIVRKFKNLIGTLWLRSNYGTLEPCIITSIGKQMQVSYTNQAGIYVQVLVRRKVPYSSNDTITELTATTWALTQYNDKYSHDAYDLINDIIASPKWHSKLESNPNFMKLINDFKNHNYMPVKKIDDPSLKRGDRVNNKDSNYSLPGIYIGRLNGTNWVAWNPEEYESMVKTFEERKVILAQDSQT